MSTSDTRYQIRFILILILCCSLMLGACDTLSGSGSTGGQYSSQEQALESGEEGAFDEIDLSGESEDTDGDSEASDENSLENFTCPASSTAVELWVDHDIKFDTPQWGTWDIYADGGIVINIAHGQSEEAVSVRYPETRIPGSAKAEWSRDGQSCSFNKDLEVVTTVDGKCENGILTLIIATNFTEVDRVVTCCSADGDCDSERVIWNLPAVVMKDLKFSAANGLSVKKEFSGGDGQFHWWLESAMPPVPIN